MPCCDIIRGGGGGAGTIPRPRELCLQGLQLLLERRKEMFYLTTHSTHFIYSYMASDIWLRTILIVRKETRCCHIGYTYRLTARVLLYAPSHRQDNTYHSLCYTSHGALAGTRNSSMGPPHEGSIRRPTTLWANALPLSYVPLPVGTKDGNVVFNNTLNTLYSVIWHQQLLLEGRKEMFYLTMHSTHFIPGYMVSAAFVGTKEGNVLFNNTFNTFYSQLYGISSFCWKEGNVLFNDTLNTF